MAKHDDIPDICIYCEYSKHIYDNENVLCEKNGIVKNEYSCRKYTFDPLKLNPKRIKKEKIGELAISLDTDDEDEQ